MTRSEPMAPAYEPTATDPYLTIKLGHTLLLDEQVLSQNNRLTISSGLVRVGLSSGDEETLPVKPITLGFLQTGDHLQLDLLRHSRLHIQALTTSQLNPDPNPLPQPGSTSLHDWTVALLAIRHLNEAEQRIAALLQLLVHRLGYRRGNWYEIPMRLTHADLAGLSGHTRVTVTRQLNRWQREGLIQKVPGSPCLLRIAPELVDAPEF